MDFGFSDEFAVLICKPWIALALTLCSRCVVHFFTLYTLYFPCWSSELKNEMHGSFPFLPRIENSFTSHTEWARHFTFSCVGLFVTSILQHYTHTHTKIYTCFSCIMDQYIDRDLKVVLSQCPPQGKSIKASQQWAISPSLADHFPSNILGPSSSEADQCCWKQKTVHSVWEQWVKWKTHWIDDFVNESWGRLCETNMPPTPTPQNTSPIALITNKLAIQSVALGLPSVYVDA